jgi:hypothetical protein
MTAFLITVGVIQIVCGVAFLVSAWRFRVGIGTARIDELIGQREYWRTRAEQLIDAALARGGAIHQPTMEQKRPADRIASAMAAVTSAMAVQEIDSSRKREAS